MIRSIFIKSSTVYIALCTLVLVGCMTLERPKLSDALHRAISERTTQTSVQTKPLSNVPTLSHTAGFQGNFDQLSYPEKGIFASKEPYSLELRGAGMDHALNLIAEMGGINLFLEGDFSDPIEVSFPGVRLDDAFKTLLENHKCTMELRDGVYVIKRPDAGNYLSHIFTLQSASSPDLQENLQTILGADQKPILSPEGDKVMITAPPETILRVAQYLDSVDQPEKQVLIEARIVEVVLTDLFQLGVELDFSNIYIDDTTSTILSSFLPDVATGSSPATFFTAADKGAVDGTLEVLKELTHVEILSRPKVLAKNGAQASIEVVEEIPYVDTTTTTEGTTDGVGTATVQEVEFKEVGLKLTVTPFIKGDRSVELKIVQDASEEKDKFLGIPVVDRRVVDTTLVVQDGELAVIGGLIKSEVRDETSGIPFFMDIPLLGYLFKSVSQVTEKRELLILIAPTVVTSETMTVSMDGYTELVSAE
ncbi:MAG: hypothetical protein KJ645_14260 [Planctomycetes bacterium]|nr:hypothetical protein [Planctomycetota bacterium]